MSEHHIEEIAPNLREPEPREHPEGVFVWGFIAIVFWGLVGFGEAARRGAFDRKPSSFQTTKPLAPGVVDEAPQGTFSSDWTEVTFSVYAERYKDRKMANGEPYDPEAYTCASNRHPLGTYLRVEHNGEQMRVKVTDRMDKTLGKTRIDLSGRAYWFLDRRYDMTDRTAGLLQGRFRLEKK